MGDGQPEVAGLDHKVSVYCSWAGETSDRLHQVLVTPTCTLSEGVLADDATVVSVYNRSTNFTTGFATLDIVALDHTDPRLSAFAAGYAEGHQTADEISQFYKNVYEFGDQGPSSVLTKWVEDNDAWTREQAEIHAATSDYWMSVATVLNRFDGMLAGYEEHRMTHHQPERELSVARLPSLSKLDLLWINLDGDLFDLQNAVGELAAVSHACRPRANSSSRTDSREPLCIASARGVRPVGRNGRAVRGFARAGSDNSTAGPMLRCSALVKYAKDEVYFGHATWDSYATAAPRIYKHLTLPRQLNEVPGGARWNPPSQNHAPRPSAEAPASRLPIPDPRPPPPVPCTVAGHGAAHDLDEFEPRVHLLSRRLVLGGGAEARDDGQPQRSTHSAQCHRDFA